MRVKSSISGLLFTLIVSIMQFLLACHGGQVSKVDIVNCALVPGFDSVNTAGQIVLLGEMHGTQEAPAFLQDLVCQALQSELSITVFLELPQGEQTAVDEFLQSDGSVEAKRTFLKTNTWARDFQDGRNSQAMFELIDYLRSLRAKKANVKLQFMDEPDVPDRDQVMAAHILQNVEEQPDRFYVALMGNIHNQIAAGSGRIGSLLLESSISDRVLSLNMHYGTGTAWVCLAEGCGVFELSGSDGETRGIVIDSYGGSRSYHGHYGVGPIHASLPARQMKFEE